MTVLAQHVPKIGVSSFDHRQLYFNRFRIDGEQAFSDLGLKSINTRILKLFLQLIVFLRKACESLLSPEFPIRVRRNGMNTGLAQIQKTCS
jgi:hypothetical protein